MTSVIEPVKGKRGTPAGKTRLYKKYRWEVLYTNNMGESIHKKYKSATDLINDGSNPVNSCALLYYYVTTKINKEIPLKSRKSKYNLVINRINEEIL